MINTHSLELPLSHTYFHGSIGVRAFEVLLYKTILYNVFLLSLYHIKKNLALLVTEKSEHESKY